MAYFVNLTNFLVTKHTSPLTLQVIRSSSPFLHCYALQTAILPVASNDPGNFQTNR
jgi:hypothetical protein